MSPPVRAMSARDQRALLDGLTSGLGVTQLQFTATKRLPMRMRPMAVASSTSSKVKAGLPTGSAPVPGSHGHFPPLRRFGRGHSKSRARARTCPPDGRPGGRCSTIWARHSKSRNPLLDFAPEVGDDVPKDGTIRTELDDSILTHWSGQRCPRYPGGLGRGPIGSATSRPASHPAAAGSRGRSHSKGRRRCPGANPSTTPSSGLRQRACSTAMIAPTRPRPRPRPASTGRDEWPGPAAATSGRGPRAMLTSWSMAISAMRKIAKATRTSSREMPGRVFIYSLRTVWDHDFPTPIRG